MVVGVAVGDLVIGVDVGDLVVGVDVGELVVGVVVAMVAMNDEMIMDDIIFFFLFSLNAITIIHWKGLGKGVGGYVVVLSSPSLWQSTLSLSLMTLSSFLLSWSWFLMSSLLWF